MEKQPSSTAKGCAFAVILLAVFGGGVIAGAILNLVF
jgi:hypothetical protein